MKFSERPRRQGAKYCSPACGRGCTWAEFEDANQSASRLANALGGDWEPKVWENLGWHYAAIHPHLSVSETTAGDGDYTVYVTRAVDGVGGDWVAHGEDPHTAVRDAIAKVQAEHESLTALLGTLHGALLAHDEKAQP